MPWRIPRFETADLALTLSEQAYKEETLRAVNAKFDAKTLKELVHPRGVVAIAVHNKDGDAAFVAFRGTTTLDNAVLDATVMPVNHPLYFPGRVHCGFFETYAVVMDNVKAFVKALDAARVKRVVLCGHSLGGALANICAANLAHENLVPKGIAVELFTFAAPPVGDATFQAAVDSNVSCHLRFFNNTDLVVQHPTWYVHGGEGVQLELLMGHLRSIATIAMFSYRATSLFSLHGIKQGLVQLAGNVATFQIGTQSGVLDSLLDGDGGCCDPHGIDRFKRHFGHYELLLKKLPAAQLENAEAQQTGFMQMAGDSLRGLKRDVKALGRMLYNWRSNRGSTAQAAVAMGALAYVISPLDLIPDATPFIGYVDDIWVVRGAMNHLDSVIAPFRAQIEAEDAAAAANPAA